MVSDAQDIEEEKRLIYVAVTRAKKALALSYATSRMRNGKHESNPPSRFIRDIDPSYLELPADFHSSVPSFGGFGSSFLNSSPARTITSRSERPFDRNRTEPAHRPAAPQRPSFSTKPEIIDPEFVPVPMTELYTGERIEHNRFGGGLILEISGTAPELKARIRFDDYGEKLLLLKYAKLRPERK